ncbi:MAG: DUF1801 domain-containing protein [Persicimonas sp.]
MLADVLVELFESLFELFHELGHFARGVDGRRGGDNLFYLAESKDHVKFGLFDGADLPDPEGIVEGTGKKMRHVKVRSLQELDEAAIAGLIEAAVSQSE